jgi:hypothetical protein
VGIWNALMSKSLMPLSVTFFSVAMLTRKKKMAMKIGGTMISASRGTARRARPATVATSWAKPAGRGSMRADSSLVLVGETVVVTP